MSLIFNQIQLHAITSPAHPAIMLPDRVASFAMIASGMKSARSVLAGFRLDREKPVGLLIENPVRHIILGLALIKSGYAIASLRRDLINPALNSGVSTILSDERLPPVDGMRCILVDESWFTNPAPKEIPSPEIAPNRVIRIVFTSGSTGRPKAIAHTYQSVVERMHLLAMLGHGQGDRIMSGYGVSGSGFLQAMMTLVSGRTSCFAPAADMLASMLFCAANSFRGSVGQLRMLLSAQEALGRPLTLKCVTVGGALLSWDLAEQVSAAFRCKVANAYASVEVGTIGFASGALLANRRTRGNRYAPLSEIRICGDDDEVLPLGAEGLIHTRSVRTSRLFTGALNLEADDVSLQWIKTGDIGRIDADGLLVVTGRANEVINMGGAKFDPEVIEAILLQHPAITGAAVLRMPGADGSHEAWAFLTPGSGMNAALLNEWFSKRVSGEALAFGFAHVETIDQIPKTASGKVERGALRQRFSSKADPSITL